MMQRRQYGADFKTCPACKKDIQKNGGCNHMTCRCGHEFCWLCMANWHPSHYSCAGLKPEDDPFLKRPDEIDKNFLAPYHETALKLVLRNREWREKEEQLVDGLARVRGGSLDTAKLFVAVVYGARENLRWTTVHQFWERFEQVKHLFDVRGLKGPEPQLSTRQKLLEFNRKQLEELVGTIDTALGLAKKGKPELSAASPQKVGEWLRALGARRDALLRQVDPHYM
jgi:hypothetical protein